MKTLEVLKIAFVVKDKAEEKAFRTAASKVKATVQFCFLSDIEELNPYLDTGRLDLAVLDYPSYDKLRYISKYFTKVPFVFLYNEQDKPRIVKQDLLYYIAKEPFDWAMHVLPFYVNKLLLEKTQNFFQWTFFQVMQQGSAAIVITDLNGDIEYVNSKFHEITGYEFDEVVGRNPSCLKSEQMDTAVYKDLWTSLKAGKEWTGDLLNKRKDGALYWERALISPLKSPVGEMYAYVKIAEDITEQKYAEEKLRLSEERYRSVIDNINIGIAMIDKNMRVLAINKQMQDWFPHAKLEDKPMCYKILRGHDQDQTCTYCPAFLSFKDGKVHESIIDVAIKDRIVSYRLLSCPIRDNDGEVVYVAELVEDVSEQRRAQMKLREALEIQSEFTSMVSHELRTPLTAIKESINIVYDGITGDISDDQKEFLGLAKANVERLARLINDILDFQKLEAGKISFHMKMNDLLATLKSVEATMLPLAKEKGLELKLDLLDCPKTAVYDKDRITQVLINLVNNAIKFTDEGFVEIKAVEKNDSIEIVVADSGMGIKAEDMSRLFQKFEQLSKGHGRQTGGTGLGLAISQQIIKQHNGQIWASSEYGKGTKFHFSLPKVADQRMWLLHKIDSYLEKQSIEARHVENGALMIFKVLTAESKELIFDDLGDDGDIISRLMSIVANHLPRTADIVVDPKSSECYVFLTEFARSVVAELCVKIRDTFNAQEGLGDMPGTKLKLSYSMAFASESLDSAGALYSYVNSKLLAKKELLVIDDQKTVLDMVVDSINEQGTVKASGVLGAVKGVEYVREHLPDMVVLDVDMPDMNGYEVLGHLKGDEKTAHIPVVLLTGTQSTRDLDKKLVPGTVLVFSKTQEGFAKLLRYIDDELK